MKPSVAHQKDRESVSKGINGLGWFGKIAAETGRSSGKLESLWAEVHLISYITKHHKITVSDETIEIIVNATEEHMRKRNQPDKSIIMMDAAMAHHVKGRGTGGELCLESVYYMIGKETGIHPDALKK